MKELSSVLRLKKSEPSVQQPTEVLSSLMLIHSYHLKPRMLLTEHNTEIIMTNATLFKIYSFFILFPFISFWNEVVLTFI